MGLEKSPEVSCDKENCIEIMDQPHAASDLPGAGAGNLSEEAVPPAKKVPGGVIWAD